LPERGTSQGYKNAIITVFYNKKIAGTVNYDKDRKSEE
jgi:hypothetical protein